MIVDSSALVAIVLGEPERRDFLSHLRSEPSPRISAVSWTEVGVVLDGRRDPVLSRGYDALVDALRITVVDVTAADARAARQAYRDFGRGSGHRARLNFGDCFSYALAIRLDEPLLFKGDDFVHTDVRRVA
ncbi:type II toxin-antitoxin system VapC family toxin [uncultured Ornithinimicrobium sp.]|uniref:type II toxin-antitoxin system VapC family toxin n=1 Tax=uncultured Ornithinimicrobium sp. TaxID=259307 RepID=UPI002593BD09|nr:type II toxin-antitoxin system VapC family toxin [uncultured Ornithinimicrobium sp.]